VLPDFASIAEGRQSYADLTATLDHPTLVSATTALIDVLASIIAGATDHAVTFVPRDPDLKEDAGEAYTLGHVIVHLTAGLEESAARGLTLARGVEGEGRSRYETPWETVKTAAQVHARLAESKRMTLAMLSAWPDAPHLDLSIITVPHFGPMNAIGVHTLGLLHASSHLEQLREIMRQA